MLMITDGTAGMNRTRNYFSLLTDIIFALIVPVSLFIPGTVISSVLLKSIGILSHLFEIRDSVS